MFSAPKIFQLKVQPTSKFQLGSTWSCHLTSVLTKNWCSPPLGIRLHHYDEHTIQLPPTLNWSIVKQERWNWILLYLDRIGTNPGTGPLFVPTRKFRQRTAPYPPMPLHAERWTWHQAPMVVIINQWQPASLAISSNKRKAWFAT
jgi:hypothetical protein